MNSNEQDVTLPTAAEARRQAIENLDSNAQKQFNTIAGQIKNAVAKGQVFLTINITYDVLHPTALAKLRSLGYRLDCEEDWEVWSIYWDK